MKTKRIHALLMVATLLLFSQCADKLTQAPSGKVPVRPNLDREPFGGFMRIETTDNQVYLGELIGQRNDSIMVFTDKLIAIPIQAISNGRVIVHTSPNYTLPFIITLIPNFILFTIPGYDQTPIITGLLFSGIDFIGYSAAAGTENLKINYYEWAEGPGNVLKYARFPGGIPQEVQLSKLEPRPISK